MDDIYWQQIQKNILFNENFKQWREFQSDIQFTVGQNAKYIPISLFWYYKNLRTNVLFASKTLKIYTFKWFLNK